MADISKEELRKEITAILTDADLNTMSAKRVRTLLEEQLEIDLTDRKKEVDELVMKCLKEQQDPPKAGNGKKKSKKDDKEDDDEEEAEDDEEEEEDEEEKPKVKRGVKKPAAKRSKKASDSEDASGDEDVSDDDYSPAKKAKGGSPKKGKASKKKGGAKGSDDDNDEDWNKSKKKGGAATKKAGGGAKKGGGYTKAYTLTPELAGLVGQESMARHEVVKKVWAIIKERNLYDPKNKQFAVCDDELLKVFGVKRFRTFGMMKYLKNHFLAE